MSLMALEAGDAATWGGTVVAFGMACYAIAQGIGQRRDLRRQNQLQAEASQLQRRQIEAAERRTLVMEQILSQLTAQASRPPVAGTWRPRAASPPPPPGTQRPVRVPLRRTAAAESEEDTGYDWLDSASDEEPDPPAEPRDAHSWGTASPPAGQKPAPQHSASPPPAPPGVWRLERFGQHGFALRNTSAEILTGVHIGRSDLPASARGVPEDSVVRPGETAEFLMAPERGKPVPDAIAVSWHGHPVPAAVPVPRA